MYCYELLFVYAMHAWHTVRILYTAYTAHSTPYTVRFSSNSWYRHWLLQDSMSYLVNILIRLCMYVCLLCVCLVRHQLLSSGVLNKFFDTLTLSPGELLFDIGQRADYVRDVSCCLDGVSGI